MPLVTEDQIPDEFFCPITGEVMKNPLMTVHGFNFERAAIFEWLQEHGTCPLSRRELSVSKMVSNIALKEKIRAYCEAYDMVHLLENQTENEDEREDPSRFFMGITVTNKQEREMQTVEARRRHRVRRVLARVLGKRSSVEVHVVIE